MTPAQAIHFLRQELRPAPYRLAGALRLTLAATLTMAIMLAFKMPLLAIGPYLAFLALQRDRFFSVVALVVFFLVFVISSALLSAVTFMAWDAPWLRIGLFGVLFYVGYYLMRTFAEPRLISGPLVIVASFTYVYDEVPNPNLIFDQIGWLWAIYGILIVAVALSLSLLPPPPIHDLARMEMRLFLVGIERRLIRRAFGRPHERWRSHNGLEALAGDMKKAAGAKAISTVQAQCAIELGKAATNLAVAAEEDTLLSPRQILAAARLLGRLRLALWRGEESICVSFGVAAAYECWDAALKNLAAAWRGEIQSDLAAKRQLLPSDFLGNREYGDFALRASLATLFCYLFMTGAHWNGIHTCLVTCVITALVSAEARAHKQRLRIAGALAGGAVAYACAIFILPRLHEFSTFLPLMAAGTFIGAWLASGRERYSYFGLQFVLAFYLMLLQSSHATDDLRPERDRWAGIILGTTAMWTAFAAFSSPVKSAPSLPSHKRQ